MMIAPKRAPVRPRVYSPYSGETLLLEDEVRTLVENENQGVILFLGPSGSGKTIALEHLAFVFSASSNLFFLDNPTREEALHAQGKGWAICAFAEEGERIEAPGRYHLAPWRTDEWIEYVLTVHPERCASVMNRLKASGEADPFGGNPELWRIVLDRMAAHDKITGPRDGLAHFLEELLPSPKTRSLAQGYALNRLIYPSSLSAVEKNLEELEEAEIIFRFLRHRQVKLLLAAARVLADIQEKASCDYFQERFPRDFVQEIALAATAQPAALDLLRTWFASRPERHAMAASILHATGTGWAPEPGARPKLAGAYLEGVCWPKRNLENLDLSEADLSHADLGKANLNEAKAGKANLRHANLQGASLLKFVANDAHLDNANLSLAQAQEAFFDGANLEHANLHQANLQEASLAATKLAGANFSQVNLKYATLTESNLEEANFTEANLEGAILSGVKLCEADFTGARFAGARLIGSNLEGMDLPQADFTKANLKNALLTGSSMPDARFDEACLQGAGLAEIDWERGSLRGADLRGSSFHLGSSRSGLVGSPIASEGSRTGFYTDDFNEQDFKSPEEIRKANLCFADLRGARIDDVDFYLVDLRHALFNPDQEPHLRRCGAILEARA